ncbi:hypothetical protein MPTK1_1g01090 [Marchantia polymorpha subsp. ruderalis]|uniref:No exine formation 1 n=2 Tax=Marchantia polymorpha TaxID=3197 RepID=A0AAF6AK70_MARPO|nr:hypothetical protein MARPO_0029s0137 [Marchantia polymorpha]BBM96840.1 hypothetical protein Mp_1g01090 [Marchantia polymorpha subsp. ruderalis]|eukprot:PTQ42643.1 hypothetical protein MARPO_0029s0137 [Marchantia polymorpha]
MAYRGMPGMTGMTAPGFESMSNGASRRRSGEPRFTPNSFQYNVRVAIGLVPSAILLLGVGGKPILGVLTVGLMISYILDSLQLRQGAFFGIWGTLLSTMLAWVLSGVSFTSAASESTVMYILTLLVSFYLIFIVGVWASLQFRWFQLENPSVVLALERLLFACIPFTAAAIQTWGVVSAVGMVNGPYYLMLIQFEMYWLFTIPHHSSFMLKTERNYGGQISEEALIAGPLESCFHTLTLLFLPLFFYVGSHHAKMFSSIYSVCDMLLLFFVPLLFLMFASSRGSLWWLAKDPRDLHQVRLVNGGIAAVVIIICLEIRVIFLSFGQYISIAPPWNYTLVTVALMGGAGAVGAFLSGSLSDGTRFVVLSGFLQTAALCGSFVLGLPYKFFPASIIAAFFLSQFCLRKNVISYFVAVLAASVPATWFVVHNFYNLNVWLGGVNIKHICQLIVGSILLAMIIPGLSLIPHKFIHHLVAVGLIGQALVICMGENRLYNFTNMYYYGLEDDVVYPSYLVVLTSVIGMALTRRLGAEKRIGSWAVWVLFCLYAGKFSMLIITSRNVLWASIVLLLAITPPLVFYKDKGKGLSRMKPWQGLLHASIVLVAVWFCRNTIFEVLQWVTGQPPSDGLLLGFLVLATGLSSAPIVTQHFPHVQSAKSAMVLVVTFGICLIFIEPPVPQGWVLSQYRTYQRTFYPDELAIYGMTTSHPSWPSWLLVATIVTSLAALTSALPIQHFVELRLFYAVGVGTSGGIYLCAQYFYQAPLLHALLVAAIVCASVFLIFTHLPSASSPRFMPWVFALLVALLPVMYLVEGQIRAKTDTEEDKFVTSLAIEGGRMSLLGLYAAIFMVIALEIKLELTTIMRDKADKLGGRASIVGGPRPRVVQQQRRPTITNSFGVKKLAAEGAWMPAIGNLATILAFALCLTLNVHLTGGSDRSIILLAPILLLLNQDANLLTGFGDRQRYFPSTAAISAYLLISGGYRLWEEVWHGYQNAGWGLETGGPGLFYAAKNTLLLFLTVPNHLMFNRFMWDYVKQSEFVLMLVSPLNIPAAIITDVASIRVLAVLGLIFAQVQYLVSRHIRIAGMKFI